MFKLLHETANLSLWLVGGKLELRLEGATNSVVIGNPSHGLDRAKQTMERMESNNNITALRKMYQHW